jgi:hypothetical protein
LTYSRVRRHSGVSPDRAGIGAQCAFLVLVSSRRHPASPTSSPSLARAAYFTAPLLGLPCRVKTYFNNIISNSILITIPIVTYFGYLFSYQYELGTARYYNIPEYLVQLDLLQVTLYAIVIYIIVFFLGLIIYLFVSDILPMLSRPNPNQKNKTKSDIITSDGFWGLY